MRLQENHLFHELLRACACACVRVCVCVCACVRACVCVYRERKGGIIVVNVMTQLRFMNCTNK